jgi:uncharacterized protein (TIGR04255 family)
MSASVPRPDIPDYSDPPVSEMFLSVQFATLPAFRSFHVGLLWDGLRQEYPNVSEQMPLPAIFETFGISAPQPVQIPLGMLFTPQMSRFWLESPDSVHVLQIQQDRIVHNWRKKDGAPYPRYEPLRAQFVRELEALERFLHRENLGTLVPNQCEIAYVNTIELPNGDNPHLNLPRMSPIWAGPVPASPGCLLEDAAFQARFVVKDGDDSIGRLYVAFTPVFIPPENRPALQLQITARGRPQTGAVADALKFLDIGRREIVQTFDNVTSPELHRIWGKRENA